MKNKIIVGIIGMMAGTGSISAFDYNVYGGAYAFSKIGFNNTYDKDAGKYPTDSFASIALEANVAGSFVEGFTYGLGGMLSAPVWDKTVGGEYPSRAYINGTSRHSRTNALNDVRNNYYSISMAYLGYEYKAKGLDVGIKAGRYTDHKLDWFSGSSEGAHIWAGTDTMRFQVNFINRRGLAENQWFYDFYIVGKDSYNTRYFVVAQFDMNFENFGIKPQIWYHRNDYIAPGVNAFYQYNSDSLSAKTGLYSLFVLNHKNGANTYLNKTNKRLGTILIVQEDISYNGWDFGLGIWKNFGNPSASGIGSHGNLAKIDIWTSSAFDSFGTDGWALTDVTSKDAFTGWLYGGQTLGDFKWEVLGRITTSKDSNEQSLALNLGYNVSKQVALGAKLEYFNDLSKNDSKIGKSVQNDRSHIFLTAAYTW